MDTQKPDGISMDVWAAALTAHGYGGLKSALLSHTARTIEITARAIMAEREACRWVAAFKGNNANMLQNDNVDPDRNRLVRDVSFEIADAIGGRGHTE